MTIGRIASLLEKLLDANVDDVKDRYTQRRAELEAAHEFREWLSHRLDRLEESLHKSTPQPVASTRGPILMNGNVPVAWLISLGQFLLRHSWPVLAGGGLIELLHRMRLLK